MSGRSSLETKAQLDKSEREHLEDVVTNLRETVEADIEYQLEHAYELNEKDGGENLSDEEVETRAELVTAVQREDDDKPWEEKFERYVMGVGYTVVNRIAALRCMEVRGFIDRPVTQFGDSSTTPAAEKLENEKYLGPDGAKIKAYDEACRKLTDEIEILFDLESPYSIVDPDVDVFEELCRKLDDVSEEVWRADDVLGWVYEYYNASKLEELRHKRNQEGLEPEDVPPANQFYTPHWVVRMLTDNSLTKMYLEANGELPTTIEEQSTLSADERKFRDTSPAESPSLADFSTYLVPTEEGEAPTFEEPKDIRVIDPACGSGHFLLYAFDVLERIWHQERPDLARFKIPEKILRHNLYGVDLDMRACQLAAFNLYLKSRGRAEEEGAEDFQMPEVGIVCADAKIANIGAASEIFDEVAGDQPDVRAALEDILEAFEDVQGLGSLLDVRGTLEEHFTTTEQPTLIESVEGPGSITKFLGNLHQKVAEHRNGESFMAQDLRSFLRVLVVLSQDYDVTLMNPPYGSGGGMPDVVKDYVEENYEYTPEFYINFFEVCDHLAKENGRIGMLVPRSFMFKRSFEDFRGDFIGEKGSFDFLAEYGLGVLDNATVRTVGTVVRSGQSQDADAEGSFLRLHDLKSEEKEAKFLDCTFGNPVDENGIQRLYERQISEFETIPGSPISYWVSKDLREIYRTETVLDADNARVEKNSLGVVKQGLSTADDDRFAHYFWETDSSNEWVPFAKGGEDSWMLPRIKLSVLWENNGEELKRYSGSYPRNEDHYFKQGLTFNRVKEGGRRFGYVNEYSIFADKGPVLLPKGDFWSALSYSNSNLFTYLMICQTPERMWEVGEISKIPWDDSFGDIKALEQNSEDLIGLIIELRQHDFESPYYNGPELIKPLNQSKIPDWYDHPHRTLVDSIDQPTVKDQYTGENSLQGLAIAAAKRQEWIQREIKERAAETDQIIFDHFDIDDEQQQVVLQEIALRTNEDPRETREYDPESITEPPEDFDELVKDLILHYTLKIVHEDDDGIVPLTFEAEDERPLLERLETEFEQIFGDEAQDQLAEADQVLGDKQPDSGAYPNLQTWIEGELFEYQLRKFNNTPVIWRLTTERLVSDPKEEGFACLVGYHQLSASLFDRIESRYLESLKIEYRERRAAADQRRSDSSLSTTEQAEAAEEYERYESALTQLNEFQTAALELSSPHPPETDESSHSVATELKPRVAEFRERTAERLETLDKLVDEMDPDEFEDHFSPTFLDRVNEHRGEWLDALEDLEAACEAYSQDESTPVEAHLYDLFSYIDDNVGSTYHGSNDITFLNHYFSKGDKYLDNGEPREGLEGVPRLLAELAAETDEDVELAGEVKGGCNQLSKLLASDWEERALQEVLATGYSPVKKHGVVINIQPLAEQNLVPQSVDDKVL